MRREGYRKVPLILFYFLNIYYFFDLCKNGSGVVIYKNRVDERDHDVDHEGGEMNMALKRPSTGHVVNMSDFNSDVVSEVTTSLVCNSIILTAACDEATHLVLVTDSFLRNSEDHFPKLEEIRDALQDRKLPIAIIDVVKYQSEMTPERKADLAHALGTFFKGLQLNILVATANDAIRDMRAFIDRYIDDIDQVATRLSEQKQQETHTKVLKDVVALVAEQSIFPRIAKLEESLVGLQEALDQMEKKNRDAIIEILRKLDERLVKYDRPDLPYHMKREDVVIDVMDAKLVDVIYDISKIEYSRDNLARTVAARKVEFVRDLYNPSLPEKTIKYLRRLKMFQALNEYMVKTYDKPFPWMM